MMQSVCSACGEVFEVTRHNRRFCSWDCRAGAAQTSRDCANCGRTFETWQSDPQRYCTIDCYRARPPEAKMRICVCQECGVSFEIRAAIKTPGKYCSRQCLGAANGRRQAAQPKARVLKSCLTCGEQISAIPSVADRKKYCSRRCNAIAQGLNNRPRSSKIADDCILRWAELGYTGSAWNWQPEHRVSRWTLDLAFPEIKLGIELDGVYWHNKPGMKEKDAARDHALWQLGWSIARIDLPAEADPDRIAMTIAAVCARNQLMKEAG